MALGTVFTAIGWVLAVLSGWVALSSSARVVREHFDGGQGFRRIGGLLSAERWFVPGLAGCCCAAVLTGLGVLPVLAGAVLAAVLFAVPALPMARTLRSEGIFRGLRQEGFALFRACLSGGRVLKADLRLVTRRHEEDEAPPAPGPGPQAAPRKQAAKAAAGAPAQAPREVPPARDDPALAPVPHPGEVAAGLADAHVEVPEPFRLLADWIANFEPETDDEQSAFLHGCAAGSIAVAEAWQVHGENMVSGVGLDPSYGAAIFDLADSEASSASDKILVDRRYHVIYGEIKQAVVNGLKLPNHGRWFGSGAAAPQDDAGEAA